MKRLTLYAALGVAIVACLTYAGQASAAFQAAAPFQAAAGQQFESQKGWFFVDLFNCAGNEAAIADQPLQIFASVYLEYPNAGCSVPKNAGAGDLRVKWTLQVKGVREDWTNCESRSWKYNGSATSYMDVSKQWSGLPCGHALYRAVGRAGFLKNGTWHVGVQTTASINKQ